MRRGNPAPAPLSPRNPGWRQSPDGWKLYAMPEGRIDRAQVLAVVAPLGTLILYRVGGGELRQSDGTLAAAMRICEMEATR
jgi:hypothetical protein